jgi:hypothetical protein
VGILHREKKKKNNMENFLNKISLGSVSRSTSTERKKTKRIKHKMSQIKILKDLPQGELPQREERLR